MTRRKKGTAANRRVAASKASVEADPSLFDESIPDTSITDSFFRIGGRLTPERVSIILASADSGRPELLVDLMHESRQKDGHLQSTLGTLELSIQSLEWDATAPEDATPEEKRAAAEFKLALASSQNLPELIAHQTGEGELFGHATSETIWKVTEDFRTWPGRFKNISCRRFSFRQSDGELLFGTNPELGVDLFEEFAPGKFIQRRPRVNGDVTVREGLCRVLVWFALFRNWTLRDWLQLAEMAWKPKRLATYKKDADKREIQNIDKLLQRLDKTGQGKKSENIDIELLWAERTGSARQSVHHELSTYCADEISKAVVGQTTSTEPGQNGSRASDQVRDLVRKEKRDAIALGVASTINMHLSKPFAELNYGPGVRPPVFFFITEERTDLKAFSEAIEKLRKAGFPIPESYIRDQTGIPERKGDEPILGESTEDGDGGGDTPSPEDEPDEEDDDAQEAA